MRDPKSDARLKAAWVMLQLVAVAVLMTSVVYLVVCLLMAKYVHQDGEFRGFVVEGEPDQIFV
ncbi:MAG: hypothetical protein ACYS9X_32515, partial [Planctomycetota bacterium]